MVIIIKKILLSLCLFFLFNTLEIDSNYDKSLVYDKNNLYEEDDHIIYFYDMDNNKLKSIINKLDIEILSYTIDDKVYYANNIDDLENKYLKDKSLDEIVYYLEYGFNIDSIHVLCVNNELIKLEKIANIY